MKNLAPLKNPQQKSQNCLFARINQSSIQTPPRPSKILEKVDLTPPPTLEKSIFYLGFVFLKSLQRVLFQLILKSKNEKLAQIFIMP